MIIYAISIDNDENETCWFQSLSDSQFFPIIRNAHKGDNPAGKKNI